MISTKNRKVNKKNDRPKGRTLPHQKMMRCGDDLASEIEKTLYFHRLTLQDFMTGAVSRELGRLERKAAKGAARA